MLTCPIGIWVSSPLAFPFCNQSFMTSLVNFCTNWDKAIFLSILYSNFLWTLNNIIYFWYFKLSSLYSFSMGQARSIPALPKTVPHSLSNLYSCINFFLFLFPHFPSPLSIWWYSNLHENNKLKTCFFLFSFTKWGDWWKDDLLSKCNWGSVFSNWVLKVKQRL